MVFGWFRNKSQGQWAAKAMACMVYADGHASEEEIQTATNQINHNPVFEKIGSDDALEIFNQTVEALQHGGAPMLASIEGELRELAEKVKEINEKNFALTCVLAIASHDDVLDEGERAMALRFKEMLGASIAIPEVGKPTGFKTMAVNLGDIAKLAAETGHIPPMASAPAPAAPKEEEAADDAAASAAASEIEEASAAAASANEQAAEATGTKSVNCVSCGQLIYFYEGYGFWCDQCQAYTEV